MNRFFTIGAAALCLMAAGCAKDNSTTTGEKAKAYFDIWTGTEYPDKKANEDGLIILEDKAGKGAIRDENQSFVWVELTIRGLDGTVISTTSAKLHEQLRTYVEGDYYGPTYRQTGSGVNFAGEDALLKGMRVGGTRTAVIPSWMLTTSRYDTQQQYIDACTSTTHFIYSISLKGQTGNIVQTEKDSLLLYARKTFGPATMPSTFTTDEPDSTFYFVSDSTAFKDVERRGKSASMKLNYTGRLLNGQVFDTTLERVAKDAGIYSAEKTYEPVSITFSETVTDISLDGSSSLVKGFQGGLQCMQWAGQTATVLFTSSLGYSSSGSGTKIPAYSPLIFEFELLKNK